MDSVEAVKTAFKGAHMWFDGTAAGISPELATHAPPGSCHTIGELVAHILHCEDGMISLFLTGSKPLWERDGWADRLGIPLLLEFPAGGVGSGTWDMEQLLAYGRTVFAQTDDYLAGLTPADLDREVDLSAAGMGKMNSAEFLLTMLLGNTYAHTGEISALKGMHGLTGYPF